MNQTINRRSLLKASPAHLAPALLAAPALAETDTPVLRLFREWEAEQVRIDGLEDETLSASELEGLRALEQRIVAEPVTCLADLAAKAVAFTDYGVFFPERTVGSLIAECEAILAGRGIQ